MIILSKLNQEKFSINCELIEKISENPDTTIELVNGNKYIVDEPMDDVIAKCIAYKRQIFGKILNCDYEGK